MHQLPAEFILLVLTYLHSPALDAALNADRTNPSPWSLSVKHPSKNYFRTGDPAQ
jgi:hypothetical protein